MTAPDPMADMIAMIHRYPTEYRLGFDEGLGDVGMTYDDDPWSNRSIAYDLGRTFRRQMEGWE